MKSFSTNNELARYAKKNFGMAINTVFDEDIQYLHPDTPYTIINLGSRKDGGTHWVAMYINGKNLYYMDSFGQEPPEAVVKFANKYRKKIYMNRYEIQSMTSGYCGYYCLLFLYEMSKSTTNQLAYFRQFLNHFKLLKIS